MTSSNLRYDEQKIDVKMAEEYLKLNLEIHSLGYLENNETTTTDTEYKNIKTRIYLTPHKKSNDVKSCNSNKITHISFFDLVEKIRQNIDLFCDLEYLTRRIPKDETRNIDLKLLINNIIYQNSNVNADMAYITEIYMLEDTPLAALGCIAQTSSPHVRIVSTKTTAVICSLFVQLCHEVGLNNFVSLAIVPSPLEPSFDTVNLMGVKGVLSKKVKKLVSHFLDLQKPSVGIVTENADVDSAVDTFLYATNRSIWRISKIYVQECVLSNFIKALEWKTEKSNICEEYLEVCTSAHRYEGRVYFFEFVGKKELLNHNCIIIEAYRTNKELITILSATKPLSLSLWSNSVAESNEISFAVDSNIVWVNDFGCFDGPPVTANAFYSLIHKSLVRTQGYAVLKTEYDNCLKVKQSWLQLDVTTRYLKVVKAYQEFLTEFKDSKVGIRPVMTNNSTIVVGNKVCVAIQKPVDLLVVVIDAYQEVLDYLSYIIQGGAVLFVFKHLSNFDEATKKYFMGPNAFSNAGIPIGWFFGSRSHDISTLNNQLRYNTKIVWSNIGTIFAN